MSKQLTQRLQAHTDNADLVAALVAFAERAPQEYKKAKAWYKPLKKAMAAFSELLEAGYTGVPVDQLHDVMRMELIKCEMRTKAGFRRYIVAEVAFAMLDQSITPATGETSLFEKLSIEILEACGEPAGGVHRLAMRIVQAIKESRPPG
jgi:hypothetical protein